MSNSQSGICGASRNEDVFAPVPVSGRRASRLRAALMGATMLAGAASLGLAGTGTASAQFVFDGGIVDIDNIEQNYPDGLFIADFNDTTLNIINGGTLNSQLTLIGTQAGVTGTVNVIGTGSTWNNSAVVTVGTDGNGSVTVSGGAVVNNGLAYIGYGPAAFGEVIVTGAGSEWNDATDLEIGFDGNGSLFIADGGAVSAGNVTLARNASSTGTLSFGAAAGNAAVAAGTLDTPTIAFGSGDGTIVFNHTDNDFELDANISGNGTIRILSGSTLLSGNNTYTGNTFLEGGTLTLGHNNALGGSTLTTTGSVVDYVDGVNIANPVVIDSDTTQFQVLAGSATQSGVISEINGPRPFEKIGDGELILTANNTWTGETIITDGTLTFDGGSVALAAGQNLFVGRVNGDDGTLNIINGGSVSSPFAYIGEDAGSVGTVTVSGAGSLMTNSAETIVGRSGTGTLNIEDGGEVNSTRSWIGRFAGSNGLATVTGTDSLWTHSTYLVVGTAGEGELTISDGGRVEVADQGIWIAEMADSVGAITVTGAGSSLVNTGSALRVGNAGSGTLTVSDGGEVANTDGYIGVGAGSTGEVTVTGTDSTWTNSNHVFVGHNGDGTLTIENGGLVSGVEGWIGRFAGASGTVTVTGAGSQWTSTSRIYPGIEGDGTLTISDGGEVTSVGGSIGFFAAGTGEVTVTGAGSGWTNTDSLIVGSNGTGTLTIEDGGTVSNTSGTIADGATSNSSATVTGAGSIWTSSGVLRVGNSGTGTLTISDGGEVSSNGGLVGAEAGSSGTATVTGTGSSWNAGSLRVGQFGAGTLTVSNGATLTSGNVIVAAQVGSSGSATVTGTGSSWTAISYVDVGDRDTGHLTISDGGVVTTAMGRIGYYVQGDGHVLVTGENSHWNMTGLLSAGRIGAGTLTIADGGWVSNTTGHIGEQAGSTGEVTVTGAGSLWTNGDTLYVGEAGTGTLTISDGGAVSNTIGAAGFSIGSSGNVTVTGAGSTWTNTSSLLVGSFGSGSVMIEDGGAVSSFSGVLGFVNGSDGDVTVTGEGSEWGITDGLAIGVSGHGTLTVADNGMVSAASAVIAEDASSTGTLNFGAAAGNAAAAAGVLDSDMLEFGLGTGRLVFNHTASSGGAGHVFSSDIASDSAGDALIRHLAGFTRLTGSSGGYQGDVEINGGMLSIDGTLGSGDITASVSNGGALTGSGMLDGDVTIEAGGILSGQSGRTFTLTGDLELQDGSSVNVALGGAGGSELFAVGGDLTLDGTLNISDAGGFGPGLYALFTYGGNLTDNGFALGTMPGGADLLPGEGVELQTSVAGEVNLVSNIGVDLLFWDGDNPANALNGTIDGGDGVWSANSFTFTDSAGEISGPSRPTPGFIVFSGAAGNVTVDEGDGEIEIAGAQFATDGYVIDGDGITLTGNGDGDAIFRVGDGTGAGAGFTATIGSDLSGDAALVLTDLGTLILTGTNSYTGGTQVRGGTLTGSTSSIIGNVANDGVVVFDQASDATLNQSLSGDGLFRFTGGAEFSLGAGNTYTGGTEVSGSGLVLTADDSAGTGTIALDDASLTFAEGLSVSNDLTLSGTTSLTVTSGAASYGGALSGSGAFTLDGPGDLTFAGNGSAFTGNTVITGNVLVNGTLGGTIQVADGGVLRGFGTLGSTTLLAGSTISPGNSVGTLTIDGDLVLETGSVYEVTVLANGLTDLVAVNGAVTIDPGALVTTSSLAGFNLGTRAVVLTATGGVTGSFQFDEAITGLPFIDSALETEGNNVVLFAGRNDTPFASLASGGNAASVAQAADTLGSGNPLWEALIWLDTAAAADAFETLQGELHATHRQLVLDDSVHTRRAVISRLAAARGEEAGSAWISGHFGGTQLGSRAGVSRASSDTSGVIFGLDTLVHESARVGVMAGFGDSSFNLTGRNASGSTESRSLGVYGGMTIGTLEVSAGAIYGWHDLTTSRAVTFPGIDAQLRSGHSADSVQVFGEVSLAARAGFEPFASLAHVRLDTGGFAEEGGAAALTIDSETRQMTQGTLGTRFGHDWQAGETTVRFEGLLGWRHLFSGHRQFVSGDLSGAPVFFEGNGVDRDAAAIEAGIIIEPMSRISLELGYAGEIGSNARNHGAEFRARWAF